VAPLSTRIWWLSVSNTMPGRGFDAVERKE
jgi:hypothetical protein